MKSFKKLREEIAQVSLDEGIGTKNPYSKFDDRKLKKYVKAFTDQVSDLQKKALNQPDAKSKKEVKKELDAMQTKLAYAKAAMKESVNEAWNNWTVKTKKKILIKGKDPVKKGTAVTVKAQNPNRAIDMVGKKWGLEKAAMALGAKEVEVFVAKESVNEASGDKEAYQKYFKGILKKFGVSSPSELKGADKKKFYDEVDAGWESDDPNDKNESVKS